MHSQPIMFEFKGVRVFLVVPDHPARPHLQGMNTKLRHTFHRRADILATSAFAWLAVKGEKVCQEASNKRQSNKTVTQELGRGAGVVAVGQWVSRSQRT